MALSEQELKDYFSAKGNILINKEKINISLRQDIFCLEYLLEEDKEAFEKYELYDEVRGAKNFIAAFNLQTLKDLAFISKSTLWMRYLEEKAEVIFTNADDNALHFRLFRGNTKVSSLDLNYYNEVMKVMNMTEHFKEWVEENGQEIEEMSYRR